jgi:hypothetical protein
MDTFSFPALDAAKLLTLKLDNKDKLFLAVWKIRGYNNKETPFF